MSDFEMGDGLSPEFLDGDLFKLRKYALGVGGFHYNKFEELIEVRDIDTDYSFIYLF